MTLDPTHASAYALPHMPIFRLPIWQSSTHFSKRSSNISSRGKLFLISSSRVWSFLLLGSQKIFFMTFIIALTTPFWNLFSIFLLIDCELLKDRAGVLFAILRLSAVPTITRALWVLLFEWSLNGGMRMREIALDHEAFSSSRET